MKQRIDLVAMFFVLGSSSWVVAQQPPAAGPAPQQQPPPPAQAPAASAPIGPAPVAPGSAPVAAPAAQPEAVPPAVPEAPPTEAPITEAPVTPPVDLQVGAEPVPTPEPEAPVAVQEVPAQPAAAEGAEIVVTGSRIRHKTAFSSAAPVQVIDRKQLEYSGASNLGDVVKNLSASVGSGLLGAAGGFGTTSINLRGLGAGATLVLVNGRRTNPSGAGISSGFQDIGTIPLAAVERLEILQGGASAIYGADAMAGVINIITRHNWDGARVELQGQTTDRLDQHEYNGSASFGATSERGRVVVATSYSFRSELDAYQRAFTKDKYETPGPSSPGFPGTFLGVGGAINTAADPACGAPGSYTHVYNPGPAKSGVAAGGQREACVYSSRHFTTLVGNTEQVSAYGSGEYDLTKHTTAYSEVVFSRLRNDGRFDPSNPVVSPGLPNVPANHVDNPYGMDVTFIGRTLPATAGATRNSAADDSIRGVVGVKGDFEAVAANTVFEDWTWDAFMTAGTSSYYQVIHDNLVAPFITALNSCSDPAHLAGCYNPFGSSLDGTGTPNSTQVTSSFLGTFQNHTNHSMQTYNVGLGGSLLELPGGKLSVALGAELRHERRQTILDHDANQRAYGVIVGDFDAVASRNVYGSYLELNWPFYDGINLVTAGRIEHYGDTKGNPISPQVGFTVAPAEIVGRDNVARIVRSLLFRGQATLGFKAPTLYQSFPGVVTTPTQLQVPGEAIPRLVLVETSGNPHLKPERALQLSAGVAWSPADVLALSVDLWHYNYYDRIDVFDPQTILSQGGSSATGSNILYDPIGKVTGVENGQVNVAGSIVTNGFDFGAMFTLSGKDFGGSEKDWGRLNFGGSGTYLMNYTIPREFAPPRVVAADDKKGLDTVTLQPRQCAGDKPGDVVDPMHPKNPKDPCQLAGAALLVSTAASAGLEFPRWRVNIPIIWTYEGHAANLTGHYSSSLDDLTGPHRDGTLDTISGYFTADAQYSYTVKDWIGSELTARVGVYNLTDAMPPKMNSLLYPYRGSIHDPRGRMVYAKLIAEF